jgi:NADPH:quinone reductase-like Zn-dependent oxidoreductase
LIFSENLPKMTEETIPKTTRALTFAKYNAPLEVTEIPLREVKPNQVLCKVYSASLNPVDYKRWEGKTKLLMKDEFPAPICFDVAGIVMKVGSEVTEFKVGQRICARSRHSGTLAEYCVFDHDVAAALPDEISFHDAAALPLAGMTALQSLRRGGIAEGQSVFITGGAGGVGTYAIQLAKHVFKASKVVTTCSAAKAELCSSLGADVCVDYTKQDAYAPESHHGEKYDVIFDTVGDARKVGKLIKPGKHVISVASMPTNSAFDEIGKPLPFFLRPIISLISLRESWSISPGLYHYLLLLPNSKDLNELVGYMKEGKIRSIIDTVFEGLAKGPEAFERIMTGRAKGKVVVAVRS